MTNAPPSPDRTAATAIRLGDPLPSDPSVRTARLDNGLELWFKPETAGVIVSELGQPTPGGSAWHENHCEAR